MSGWSIRSNIGVAFAALLLIGGCDSSADKLAKENADLKAQLAAQQGGGAGVARQAGEGTSTLYYSNGRMAWGGSVGNTVYHSNGKMAWGGSPGNTVYHDNGTMAWGGSLGNTVYYSNGKMAWGGSAGNTAYHDNGAMMQGSANGVSVPLGEGVVLVVRADNATLNVLGTSFPLS